jgi:hypothetical protein
MMTKPTKLARTLHHRLEAAGCQLMFTVDLRDCNLQSVMTSLFSSPQKQAMRHSFFYLQRQVEVNVMENGGTWRWAFIIDGSGPSVTDKGLTDTAVQGLQAACQAARTVLAQS